MGLEGLAEELESLAAEATDHPALQYLNPSSSRYQITMGWTVGPLVGLEEFGEKVFIGLGWGPTRYFRSPGGSVTAITPAGVAQWLIAQARYRPAEEVLAEFGELVAIERVTYLEIVALWGIAPTEPLELGIEGIRLVPIADLPSSDHRDAVTGVRVLNIPEAGIPLGLRPRATAAMVRELDVFAALSNPPPPYPYTVERELMYELARMLVTVNEAPVVPFGHWIQAAPATPYLLGGEGGFNVTSRFLARSPETHVISPELLQHLVVSYLNMTVEDRRKLRVPLARFNSALIRAKEDAVEAAIDMGIAMEAFLCPDEDTKEIQYRFALRGALYLGNSHERAATKRELRRIYHARSDAVHRGTLGKRSTGQQLQLLEKARDLFVAMLRRSIQSEALPRWEDVELGIAE